MELTFIKMMKENETDFMGFKNHSPIEIAEDLSISIKANSLAYCEPQSDAELDEYKEMEFSILLNEEKTIVSDLYPELKEYEEFLVTEEDEAIYGNVPIDMIEKLYQKLLTHDEEESTKEKSENDSESDEIESIPEDEPVQEEMKPKNNPVAKKKITRKSGVKKINAIQDALNKKFYEREEEIEGMLVALLSGQHVLLIGEPGTGKSLLSMELANIIDGSDYFQWLLTKYTTPEELFGALSLKELEKGVHVRNVKDKLPEAHLAFLDEIFKSNSAILNSLLTLINERIFYNNGTPIESPLISLIGASNEYPEEDEGLEAMFDRLLLRYEVKQVRDRNNFVEMLKDKSKDIKVPSITIKELYDVQDHTNQIVVSDRIYETIADICQELEDEGIRPSARRVKNSIEAIKAKTFIDGRTHVEEKDLIILNHILWNDIHEKEDAINIIKNFAQDNVENVLDRVKVESVELLNEVRNSKSRKSNSETANYDQATEISSKLKSLAAELEQLNKDNPGRTDEIKVVLDEINEGQQSIFEELLLVNI